MIKVADRRSREKQKVGEDDKLESEAHKAVTSVSRREVNTKES